MEAPSSMASSAAKLVWGEKNNQGTATTNTENQKSLVDRTVSTAANDNTETQSLEPSSGKLGDTLKGEPFDAGNIEPTKARIAGLETCHDPLKTAGASGKHTKSATTGTSGLDTHSTPSTAQPPGETGTHTKAASTETAGKTGGTSGPASELASTTGDHGGFKAAQADIRDPESSATTDPKVEARRKNVDDTGSLDEDTNPGKADGPGPRPIEEVARERGGDAGAHAGGAKKDDDQEGLGGSSDSKGTGEQYVKTSGLKADGGDFDATKPGAGREADRILEEKGIHNPAAAAGGPMKSEAEEGSPTGLADSKRDKTSLKDKIKAKLHKN